MSDSKKSYLGDSVYAAFDGNGIWLTTENGYPDDPRNKIYLEPEVLQALYDFTARLKDGGGNCEECGEPIPCPGFHPAAKGGAAP